MTPHLYSLGAQVCELEPGTILVSDPKILEKLKLCPALAGAQQDALNALLLSGDTAYGDPSGWDSQTLQDLGPLVLALNRTTLSLVAEAAREDFRRSIVTAYIRQGRSQRKKSLLLLRALAAASASSRPRLQRREDSCRSKPITSSNIDDILLVIFFSPDWRTQLDLCLSNNVLIDNLEAVLDMPIPKEGRWVLKKKVDEYFKDSGIPEEQLRRLGELSRLYTEQEISKWSLNSSETLSALLSPSGGDWNDSQVQQLLTVYLNHGGCLTGSLLRQIGSKRLCKMQEEQIQKIPAKAMRTAGKLDISSCNQTKKELLYKKAQEAFASLASNPSPYYSLMQPYLGGAPAKDLKDLANTCAAINMDLSTFLTLNPEELQKLSVTDVKFLMGVNLQELKDAKNEPLVVTWVQQQPQQELDCVLGIGLQGGQPGPTGTACPVVTCPAATSPASVTSTATLTTSPHPTSPASGTSTATVTTSPHPATSANVTPVPTTLPTATSASVTPVPTTLPTDTSSSVTPVPTTLPTDTSASVTPVPTTLPTATSASVTSTATLTTPPYPTSPANVTSTATDTSTATVTTSPYPTSLTSVTPVPTTLPTAPSTSATVTSTATVPTATPTARPAGHHQH
nr:mesothelin-like protein [Taeniopygia guttata]